MRIGIDARFFGSIGKGLGRYTQKLIENLEKIENENPESDRKYFVFLRKDNFDDYQPKSSNFQKVLADYKWYTFSEQWNMPRLLGRYKLDLVHFPHFNIPIFYRKKFVITIHDLILIHFPTIKGTTLNPLFYWFKFLAYKVTINSAVKRAQKIITVSNFTKNDILEHYKIGKNRVAVAYEACEDFCYVSPGNKQSILEKYGIIKPYILYVGNAYPHKNLDRLVLAFKEVAGGGRHTRLVLVGKEDYFYQKIKRLVADKEIKDVIFTGFVSDRDLDAIYQNAQLYVFPSLYEGFGLPPLEAMAKGAPVASSDHECMREVLGGSACYFDGKNIGKIATCIDNLLSDQAKRSELSARGYQQVEKYSWKRMARETLEIYQKITKGKYKGNEKRKQK